MDRLLIPPSQYVFFPVTPSPVLECVKGVDRNKPLKEKKRGEAAEREEVQQYMVVFHYTKRK